MRTYTVDQMYTAEEQSYLWAMRDFFKIDTSCVECIMRRMPPDLRTELYSTTGLLGEPLELNIAVARKLCTHPRIPLMTWSPDELGTNLSGGFQMQHLASHIDHIPPDMLMEPGIQLILGEQDEQIIITPIDGSHRAAYCLRERRDFHFYLLPPTAIPLMQLKKSDYQDIQARLAASGFLSYFIQQRGTS